MINKTGYTGVVKNASPISSNARTPSPDPSNGSIFFGKIKEINLSPDNYLNMGEIIFTDFNGVEIGTARPFSSNLSVYPTSGELVVIFYSKDFLDESLKTSYFYLPPLNVFKNPNSNAVSIPTEENYSPSFASSPQISYPSYIKANIHPLFPYTYDVLFEGSFGSSLRFGSTNRSQVNPNPWSDSGEEYSPITILSNGHDPSNTSIGYIPTVENINRDLSSIYLTSNQKLPFSISREEFQSQKWITPPLSPSEYVKPQIITNSDRIVINAKDDSILISAKKSIGLSCYEEINLIGKNIVIDGQNVYLGSKNNPQPVLKGNDTVEYLKILITELKNLSEALKTIQNWPGGVPVPNSTILTVANASQKIFEKVYNDIDSIKSNFVKTI